MERIHVVREGDTVLSICLANQISYETFIALNPDFNEFGVRSPDLLRIGERLVVGNKPLNLLRRRR